MTFNIVESASWKYVFSAKENGSQVGQINGVRLISKIFCSSLSSDSCYKSMSSP